METIPSNVQAINSSVRSLEYSHHSRFRGGPRYSLYLGLLASAFSVIGILRIFVGRTPYSATHLPRWHFKFIAWLATQLQPFWLLIFLAVPCICLAGIVVGAMALKRENPDRRWAVVGMILSAANLLWMLTMMTRL